MPTYEYKCLDCGYLFEEFQKMTDEPLKVCPECNGNLKRLIGAGAGPIFKGTGFYQTDYKNSSGNKSAGKKEVKSESKKPDKKTDTKAAGDSKK